jgi:hypothetical protein
MLNPVNLQPLTPNSPTSNSQLPSSDGSSNFARSPRAPRLGVGNGKLGVGSWSD